MSRVVLVTGATSGLGLELVRALRARGDRVVAFVRRDSPTGALYRMACRLVEGDVTDAASVARAAHGCDAVVHAAARVGDWGPAREFERVNVGGTEHVLAAARAAGVARFVHVSSASVYGDAEGPVVTEATTLRPSGLPYPDSKLAAEAAVFRYAAREALPVSVVRPALIYGPHDRTFLPRVAAMLRRRTFVYVVDPETPVNLTHVDNAVDVILRALEAPAAVGEAFNVCDGAPVTLGQIVGVVCRQLNLPPPRLRAPTGAVNALAAGLEAAWTLARRHDAPPLTRYALRIMARGYRLSIDKAREVLGWTPRVETLEGLVQACQALR